MSNAEVRKRLNEYKDIHPVSLSKIGCLIGLDIKHRYVLSNFLKGQWNLNDETLSALDSFLQDRGF